MCSTTLEGLSQLPLFESELGFEYANLPFLNPSSTISQFATLPSQPPSELFYPDYHHFDDTFQPLIEDPELIALLRLDPQLDALPSVDRKRSRNNTPDLQHDFDAVEPEPEPQPEDLGRILLSPPVEEDPPSTQVMNEFVESILSPLIEDDPPIESNSAPPVVEVNQPKRRRKSSRPVRHVRRETSDLLDLDIVDISLKYLRASKVEGISKKAFHLLVTNSNAFINDMLRPFSKTHTQLVDSDLPLFYAKADCQIVFASKTIDTKIEDEINKIQF
jgi:hypothetical protein